MKYWYYAFPKVFDVFSRLVPELETLIRGDKITWVEESQKRGAGLWYNFYFHD